MYNPLVSPNVTKKNNTVAKDVDAAANELPNSIKVRISTRYMHQAIYKKKQ